MTTLVDLILERGATDAPFARYLETGDVDGPASELTYAQLSLRARAVAARLLDEGVGEEPVLLVYPPGLEFFVAFLGCVMAGAIAVPVYPPNPSRFERTLGRLEAIAKDCGARWLLTKDELVGLAPQVAPLAPQLGGARWLGTDSIDPALAERWRRPARAGLGLCHLQYTSGSTGSPRGVRVTHANVLHNSELIRRAFHQAEGVQAVSWLPSYHDMGLIGGIIGPLYHGGRLALISPVAFLQRPLRWLEAISRLRATGSGAPDFAYALVTRRITDAELERLDLSSWQVAFCGAEPVRQETAARFLARFARCGLRPEAFDPTYGLAEATLIVSVGRHDARHVTLAVDKAALAGGKVLPGDKVLVSCGPFLEGMEGRIVDTTTRTPKPEREVGEIWLRGGSVADGYWNQPEKTAEVFQARTADGDGPWLRTGDLGFLDKGELYVVGRLKDLLIIHGRNVHPPDLEYTVENAHPSVRASCVAAFGVEEENEERAVIAAEVDVRAPEKLEEVHKAVLSAVAMEHELGIHVLVLCPRGTLPKTSSGKLQRFAVKAAFLAGTLESLARFDAKPAAPPAPTAPAAPTLTGEAEIASWLRGWVATASGYAPEDIDPEMPLVGYGLSSAQAVELASELGDRVGRPLDPALTFDHPTIKDISRALAAAAQGAPAVGPVPASSEPARGLASEPLRRDAASEPARGLASEPLRRDATSDPARGLASEPLRRDAASEPARGLASEPLRRDATSEPARGLASEPLRRDATSEPARGLASEPLRRDAGPIPDSDSAPTPPLSTGNLLLLDFVFTLFLTLTAGPALLGTAALTRLLFTHLPWQAVVALSPLLGLLFLLQLGLLTWLLRLLLPRPRAGIHPLGGSEALAWGLHFALQRVVSLPVWRPVFQSVATLRWVLLRALGADVPFRLRSAMDAEILDAHLLSIGEDAMLAGGTSVSAHLTAGDQLHLAAVKLERGVELWAGASVALGGQIGAGTIVGVRTMLLPHVRIGAGCVIGSFCRIDEGARIGDGARVGSDAIIGRGAVIDPGARVAEGTRVPPGARIKA